MRALAKFALGALLGGVWSGCGGATNASGGSSTPAYAACGGPGECVVEVPGCCGVCGEPTLADVEGVNSERTAEFKAATCTDPHPTCPKCATAPAPNLVAFCDAGACAPHDLRQSSLSECGADADCMLRDPSCCESCLPPAFTLVALAKKHASSYTADVCKPMQACPACAPVYPTDVVAECGADKHCKVVQKANLCPPAQPLDGNPCSLDPSIRCEYGDDARPGCRTHVTCQAGVFRVAVSGCPPLPGPGEQGCPAATPPSGDSCTPDGLVCDMGGSTYCACASCAGPCSQFPRWSCGGPPTTEGCPPLPPRLGIACSTEALVCTYGVSCIPPISAGRRCKDGAWVDEPLACPV